MRSLFARILIGFWIALTLMAGTLIVLEAASRQRGFPTPRGPGEMGRLFAAVAGDALERGPASFDSLARRVERESGFALRAVDADGRAIGPTALPRGAAALAREVLASGEGRRRDDRGRFLEAIPVTLASGRRVVLLVSPPFHPGLRRPDTVGGPRVEPGGGPRSMPRMLPFIPRDLGWRAAAAVLIGGIACYLLARHLAGPVRRLRDATRRLAEGDLSARAGSGGPHDTDELAGLASDFDRMAERVEAVISSQRRLLSDISHELRSPLARMNVAIGLMRQRGAAPDPAMIARLEREAERLNRLIGDLLTLSRLESGERVDESAPFDLAELVADVVDDASFEATARGCEVRLAPAATARVVGAPELLRSALENVVRNALRHTADGTAVEVSLACEGDGRVRVDVRDHGPGVPAEHLERIFEPFHRVDEARDRQSGGAGLGLAIAHRAVVQHGGTIAAAPAPGGGLLVRIRLPLAT